MARRVWVTPVGLLLGLSLSAPGFAGEGKGGGTATEPAKPAAPAEKPAAKAAVAKEVKGKVISVNAGTKTLIVEVEGKEEKKRMIFSVAEAVTKDLATIKNGDQVTVRYIEGDGKFKAQEVTKG